MEEIDIIELLKRVKEGKAPKEIEIKGKKYNFVENSPEICCMYKDSEKLCYLISEDIYIDTKIKILDKPIIEELEISTDGKSPILIKKDGKTNNLRTIDVEIINKTNEIIKWINDKENKDDI